MNKIFLCLKIFHFKRKRDFKLYPNVDVDPPKVPNENPVLAVCVVPENPVFAESVEPKLNSFLSDPNEKVGAVVAVDPLPSLKLVSAGLEAVEKPVDGAEKTAGVVEADVEPVAG